MAFVNKIIFDGQRKEDGHSFETKRF